ncbi:MAG: hypothetical protein KDE51_12640, partial [Anaerolineales bacterium]|nr:hypothetical protein [Anaerolineales bacterium]
MILDLWYKNAVIYNLDLETFLDTDGDGVGDFEGLVRRLDYIHSLGCEVIWLAPFQTTPNKDNGYDIADYYGIDQRHGTAGDFVLFMHEAKKRGIKVIIDLVINHTSDQHPWFLESRQNKDNPKRDWYMWANAQADGSPPNNWGSVFGGPAWTWDEHTEQYYLHQFVREQPELNWRNPEVQQAMMNVLRFWLERGVDGFRMDVVGHIFKDEALPDNPPRPYVDPNLPENDLSGRTLPLYTQNQPEIHPIFRQFRQLVDSYGEKVIIGEVFGDPEFIVSCYGETGDELHLPFNFLLLESPWEAVFMRGVVERMEALLPPFAWPNYVLGNHDRARLATKFGGQAQARTAAMMLLTLRGTPTLYQGDEIGTEDVYIPPEKLQDPQGINLGAERSRDACRTPMQWDDSQYAGFSETEPWLPLTDDYKTRNVAVMQEQAYSILNLYDQLLTLRRQSAALQVGTYTTIPTTADDHCYAYQRTNGAETKIIALNFTDSAQTI